MYISIRKGKYLQLRMLVGSFALRVDRKALEQYFTIRAELESSMRSDIETVNLLLSYYPERNNFRAIL